MSTHDNDFWGNQTEWESTPEPLGTSGAPGRAETDRTQPIEVVRRGWKQILGAGASNATREHGVVRPDSPERRPDKAEQLEPAAVRSDMFDDLDDGFDEYSYAEASSDSEFEPTMATPIVESGTAVAWGKAFTADPPGNDEAEHFDPLLARLGALAVVAILLIPLVMNLRSGGGEDLLETAGADSTELLNQSATPADVTEASDAPTTSQTTPPPIAQPVTVPSVVAEVSTSSATTIDSQSDSTDATSSQAQQQSTSTDPAIQTSAVAESLADRIPRNCPIDYEIVAGDFWIRIADGAGVPLAELLEANDARVTTPLYPGASICLPAGSKTPPPPPATTTATTVAPTTTAAPTTTQAPTTTVAPTTTQAPTTTVPAAPDDVQQIIRNVWPDELEDRALEIAYRESRYVPTAQNYCCYGIFQIYWNVHKSWLDELGITSAEQLFDPETNARAAYGLYQRAGGWSPWNL